MGLMGNTVSDPDSEGWRSRASCRHVDAELFFPPGSRIAAITQIAAAKAVCRKCPVQDQCLQFALETNQEAGIWGGTDEDERRRLRRAWRASGRPPVTSAAGRVGTRAGIPSQVR